MEIQNDLKELLAALCKAQAEYPDIPKTRTGQEGNRKFKYADLNDIHKATRAINAKYGLTTPHETTDTHLITRLFHAASGQSLSTALPIKLTDQPKHTGATLTYLKRYNIQSLLDISTEEDLDSIDTSKPSPPPEKPFQRTGEVPAQQNPQGIYKDGKKVDTSKGVGSVPGSPVSEAQLKRMFAISHAHNWSHEQIKLYMAAAWGLESSKDLDRVKYDRLISVIESGPYIAAIKGLGEKNGQ